VGARPAATTAADICGAEPSRASGLEVLISFGPSTRESVYTEANSTRPADPSDVDEALVRLESLELVESRLSIEDDQSETLFFPSSKAARLKGHIPLEPQTVTEFYYLTAVLPHV
jgi:hypothetical protein